MKRAETEFEAIETTK